MGFDSLADFVRAIVLSNPQASIAYLGRTLSDQFSQKDGVGVEATTDLTTILDELRPLEEYLLRNTQFSYRSGTAPVEPPSPEDDEQLQEHVAVLSNAYFQNSMRVPAGTYLNGTLVRNRQAKVPACDMLLRLVFPPESTAAPAILDEAIRTLIDSLMSGGHLLSCSVSGTVTALWDMETLLANPQVPRGWSLHLL